MFCAEPNCHPYKAVKKVQMYLIQLHKNGPIDTQRHKWVIQKLRTTQKQRRRRIEDMKGHERTGKNQHGRCREKQDWCLDKNRQTDKEWGDNTEMNYKTWACRRKAGKQTKTGSERSSINRENKTVNPKHDNVITGESVIGHCTLLLTDQRDKQSRGGWSVTVGHIWCVGNCQYFPCLRKKWDWNSRLWKMPRDNGNDVNINTIEHVIWLKNLKPAVGNAQERVSGRKKSKEEKRKEYSSLH